VGKRKGKAVPVDKVSYKMIMPGIVLSSFYFIWPGIHFVETVNRPQAESSQIIGPE
jgi:hypothetical protein